MKTWLSIFIALLAGLLYLLHRQFPHALSGTGGYLSLLSTLIILASIVFSVVRSGISKELVIKSSAVWLGIAVIGLSVYSYQWEARSYFYRVLGHLVPSMAQSNKDGSVTFYAADNGHFLMDALVNGHQVHFLLDTGATRVTLSAEDAQSLGINLDKLRYDIAVHTAKGINHVAYTKLDRIQLGDIAIKDVDAYVAREGLSGSLLGMSFLNKLKRYQIDRNRITLWE